MLDDSLAPPAKSSPFKAVAAVAAIVGLAAGGWWMFGRGKGQAESSARVLIVGPTAELGGFLENEGFEATHLSVPEAIGEGQRFDASTDSVAAMLEFADQSGIGFLALNMSHGQTYDFASVGYDAGEGPPPGTTFAVLSVGDLGKVLTFGAIVPEVHHDKPAGEKVGLLLALFGHEQLAKAKTREADNELMIRFGSASTVEDLLNYEKGQENMRRQIEVWRSVIAAEEASPAPIEFAQAYETLRGWPLANGSLLLASGREAWASKDGRSSEWRGDTPQANLFVVALDALDTRIPCTELPDTLPLDGGFAVSPAGDALLIPSDTWIADLWVLDGPGCSFVKRDQIRRLDNRELGHPRASGRTAASQSGRLNWADAKMRKYRTLDINGVEFHDGELHWAGDETVVVPASLDYARAAFGQEALDPSALPANREALIVVKLPPPLETDTILAGVIPIDALLGPDAGDASQLAFRDVFALPSAADGTLELVALIDSPQGSKLVRAKLGGDASIWHNVVDPEFDLAKASVLPKAALTHQVLTEKLPHEAHHLTISPTGSHAAWSAPAEHGQTQGAANFEIFTLALDAGGAAPVQATQNTLADQHPRFVGERGQMLVFNSNYQGAEKLPEVQVVRAIPITP